MRHIEGGGQVAADPTRRAVLAAAAVPLLLAGCRGIGALGPLPQLAPQVRTLDRAITDEQLMIARYQAAVGSFTGQGAVPTMIAAILAEHQQHLVQLRRQLVLPPRLATASPAPAPAPPQLPADRGRVVADLARAERSASTRLARQLLHVPPALAQLMASISASEAAHAALLAQARRR